MSKKTLNEATVRQFMKLVNHKPATISNFISENYNEEEQMEESAEATVNEEEDVNEGMYEEEEVSENAEVELSEEDEDADPVGEPPLDMAPEEGGAEVDITPEMASAIVELGDMLRPLVAGDDEPAEPMDEPMPEPEPAEPMDPPGDDDEAAVMETTSEEQMVQEVARRVAERILKAKETAKDSE